MMVAMRKKLKSPLFVALTLMGAYLVIGVALTLLMVPSAFTDTRSSVIERLLFVLMWPLWIDQGNLDHH